MRIAFWSEQKKAGTAFNLAAVASTAVCLYPLSVAVVSGGYHDKKLERKFFQENRQESGQDPMLTGEEFGQSPMLAGEEFGQSPMLTGEEFGQSPMLAGNEAAPVLAAETQEFVLFSGLDCLLARECREDLTEEIVRANMRQIVKDRLYYLPTSVRPEYEWWHRDCRFARMNRVMDAVESYFDLVFIDCGSRQDDYARKLFREADVCVLNMNQSTEVIGRFYSHPPDIQGELFFLIGRYFENDLYNRANLQRIYRLEEERLGAIPYNPYLHAAERMGKMDNGVKSYVGAGGEEKRTEFEKELVRTTNLILKLAGVVS